MSDFDKQLIPIYAAAKRQEIRCICVVACVTIVMASALGAMFYCMPPPFCVSNEPVTYEYTDANGTTTTTTTNGRQTITTATTADGKIISVSIVGGRKSSVYIKQDKRNAAERKARQERKAAERAKRKAQREARRLEKQAAKLERKTEKLRRKAERYK